MSAKGSFSVELTPQGDGNFAAGRMIIDKSYTGDLEGTGTGQMISKRIENGAAVYFAIEEFVGTVGGKKGAFTLLHKGFMSSEEQLLEITILQGSGSGELAGIAGTLEITQEDGTHQYRLKYSLEKR